MANLDHIDELGANRGFTRETIKRSAFDRRSSEDKRIRYNLDYFTDGGEERRTGKERRKSGERRSNWARVYK